MSVHISARPQHPGRPRVAGPTTSSTVCSSLKNACRAPLPTSRIRLHGTPTASLAAIASSSTGVITTMCSRYSTVLALVPQSRASDWRRDSMSRVIGVAAVTTPGSPEESISALATGCASPGIAIASMDWLRARLALVRDQHTLDAPDPSDDAAADCRSPVAARKCSASGDLDLAECNCAEIDFYCTRGQTSDADAVAIELMFALAMREPCASPAFARGRQVAHGDDDSFDANYAQCCNLCARLSSDRLRDASASRNIDADFVAARRFICVDFSSDNRRSNVYTRVVTGCSILCQLCTHRKGELDDHFVASVSAGSA